jgi:hypothetical protein
VFLPFLLHLSSETCSTSITSSTQRQPFTGEANTCFSIRKCVFHLVQVTGANDGGAVSITGGELQCADTIFDECSSRRFGGALFLKCKIILIRCCGRFCTARTGTFLEIQDGTYGPHEFSQATVVLCGSPKTWADSGGQKGGLFLGRQARPFFNHLNMTSNSAEPEDSLDSGRGAAIYGLHTSDGFNCTFLTLFNNSGHAIVDCGSVYLTRFSYVNVVNNYGDYGIVYGSVHGLFLSHCIFVGNKGGGAIYRSDDPDDPGKETPFILSNCYFDSSPGRGTYTVIESVFTGTTGPTHEIGHFHTSGCVAAIVFRSKTFTQTVGFSPTRDQLRSGGWPRTQPIRRSWTPAVSDPRPSSVFVSSHGQSGTGYRSETGCFSESVGWGRASEIYFSDAHPSIGVFMASRLVRTSVAISSAVGGETVEFTSSESCLISPFLSESLFQSSPDSRPRGFFSASPTGSPSTRAGTVTQTGKHSVEASSTMVSTRVPDGQQLMEDSPPIGTGMVIGIVGGLLVLILLASLFTFLRLHRQQEHEIGEEENDLTRPDTQDSQMGGDIFHSHEYVNVLASDDSGQNGRAAMAQPIATRTDQAPPEE